MSPREISTFVAPLGVSREAPVGFESIRLKFALSPLPSAEQIGTLAKLCERYCVVAQSLKTPISIKPACPMLLYASNRLR